MICATTNCSRMTKKIVLLVLIIGLSFSDAFFQNLIPSIPKLPTNINPSKASEPLLAELEKLISATQNGVADPATFDQVQNLMIQISNTRPNEEDQRKMLPGTWELVYTTEKEINFFKTSWPFAKVSSITQRIDLYNQVQPIVENYIDFEGGGQFAVTGTVQVDDDTNNRESIGTEERKYDRVAFSFTTATAVLWGTSISLPPTGAGWFDTLFCNDQYRLSRDSRGDYSIFRRIS
ncbi:plastid lipid-associated PAP/fibrillin family protein [Nitzschia inconspicua]|uniref:Plastid lipid-associated PAP/fibrillin family protein n=1 Tax=Nitzschia inconspicua TaxID=303405 RepID=A0A9K3LF88_9STRA|nr:plastid lipid-associated PAP/fibrillin family protein [Nitzschia inconspicua]